MHWHPGEQCTGVLAGVTISIALASPSWRWPWRHPPRRATRRSSSSSWASTYPPGNQTLSRPSPDCHQAYPFAPAIIAACRAVAVNVMVVDVARALVVVNVEQREPSSPVAMSPSSRLSHRRPRRASPIVPSSPVRPRRASPIVARQAVAIVVTRQARADGSAADPNASRARSAANPNGSRAKRAPLPPLCHRRSRLVSGPTLTQSEQSEVDFVARRSLRCRHHRLRRRPSRRRFSSSLVAPSPSTSLSSFAMSLSSYPIAPSRRRHHRRPSAIEHPPQCSLTGRPPARSSTCPLRSAGTPPG